MSETRIPTNFDAECAATTQAVEFVANSRLRRGRSPEQIDGLFRKVDLILDTNIAEAQRRRTSAEPIACVPGCDHCCHRVVFSTVLEAFDAASYIVRELTFAQQDSFRIRLQQYFADVGPNMGQELDLLRIACPMLENGRCTIYPVRPLMCRSQFSSDLPACEQARKHSNQRFPASEPEMKLGTAAQVGLATGMNACGLWWQSVDFARTVGLALADPLTYGHYMSGLSMFEIAAPVVEHPVPAQKTGAGTSRYGRGDEPTGLANQTVLERSRHLLRTKGDAVAAFKRDPSDGPLQQMFRMQVPVAYQRPEEIEYWRNRMVEAFEDFASSHADPREKFDAISAYNIVSLSYQQRNDRELLSRIGDYLTNEVAAKVLPDLCEPLPKRRHQGRLRVGYISVRLAQTSGSYWSIGWLKNHSADIETYAFYVGPTLIPGAEEFERHAHKFFHCPGPVPAVARLIKEQDLDVLIYTDASAEGRTMQFATLRLAPVQCASWGDPETLGMPNIDYMLSSEWMEPEEAAEHYRETLVRLPGTGICFPRPDRVGTNWGKTQFGLDDGPLYLCTQAPSKLLPQWDAVFSEICNRTGRPIVFFSYNETAVGVAERRLKAAGVKAIFMPCLHARQFYDILNLADATLDSIGWSGGITTLLALQQKRPVVTLPGEFRRGRQSMAFLKAANASGLVAESPGAFIELACSPDHLTAAMQRLQPETLFDDKSSVAGLESFLLSVTSG